MEINLSGMKNGEASSWGIKVDIELMADLVANCSFERTTSEVAVWFCSPECFALMEKCRDSMERSVPGTIPGIFCTCDGKPLDA